jgi:acid phosphatase (class A)
MARLLFIILNLSIVYHGISFGQNVTYPAREFTPIRGHYKMLAAFSPLPKSSHEEIDKVKFPFDQGWADKVLSDKPVYLGNVAVDDFRLPGPPANSSEQTRAELNYLLILQHNRSMEDVRSSLYMSSVHEKPSDIGCRIGYWTGPQTLPLTDSLLDKVNQDADFFLWSLKFKYCRARPYMLEPKLHDLEESLASSYPSGHVTFAYIYAYIYQELAPEFTDFFIKQAYDMAHAREVIGVHYPSDCEGSRIFARQFVNMLFENARFRQDFENVKREWASKEKASRSSLVPTAPHAAAFHRDDKALSSR